MSPSPYVSLTVCSLEIGRVLADHDGMTFRVHGTCMYPALRPGDVLRIRSCSVSDLAVGDIAVCRTSDRLFGHRVVETGQRHGRAFVVTRPDRARRADDAPRFDEDLLGVVESITRGRLASVLPTAYAAPLRSHHRARLACLAAYAHAHTRLTDIVERLQERPVYRALARHWFTCARPRLRLTVRVPLDAATASTLSREILPTTFHPGVPWYGRPIPCWTLAARVNDAPRLGAWITFAPHAPGGWRLVDAQTRLRYRGTGLDALLMREAHEIAIRSGVSIVTSVP